MNTQLLEIQPNELKFIFELKKQSSCTIRLTNITDYCVAFKVKTTSPKKYCVRPTVGVIKPKSTCNFSVMMQAQRTAPPDLECKDKFLIQSTIVPERTTDEDITSSMFVKDGMNYIEEKKLRVTLISPPDSPTLSPMDETLKQGPVYEALVLKNKDESITEISSQQHMCTKDIDSSKLVNMKDPNSIYQSTKDINGSNLVSIKDPNSMYQNTKDVDESNLVNIKDPNSMYQDTKDVDESNLVNIKDPNSMEQGVPNSLYQGTKDVDRSSLVNVKEPNPALCTELKQSEPVELKPTQDFELKTAKNPEEFKLVKDIEVTRVMEECKMVNVEESKPAEGTELTQERDVGCRRIETAEELKLAKDIEAVKSKLNDLESKLSKAEITISKLTEERSSNIEEREILQENLADLSKRGVKTVQVGFPPLFVCMVALVSVFLGYYLRF